MAKLNIVFPMGSARVISSSSINYPLPIHEISGKTLIEIVLDNFNEIDEDSTYHFILNQDTVDDYKLDKTLNLLSKNSYFKVLSHPTKGALCSVLMAIDDIDENEPLIIANHDQIFKNGEVKKIFEIFMKSDADAACPIFSSVHPRWSFVKTDKEYILEASEKNPISKNAIAGIYLFKKADTFFNAAFNTLQKSDTHNNNYFISSVLNQIILENMKVASIQIDENNYYSFFTQERIINFDINDFKS